MQTYTVQGWEKINENLTKSIFTKYSEIIVRVSCHFQMAVNIKKIKDQTTLNQDYGLVNVLIKSSLWCYWSLRLDLETLKGYGAAISKTLTWEGPEVPFFFLQYIYRKTAAKTTFHEIIYFFLRLSLQSCIGHHHVMQFVVLSLNSSHFGLWHCVTSWKVCWFVVQS